MAQLWHDRGSVNEKISRGRPRCPSMCSFPVPVLDPPTPVRGGVSGVGTRPSDAVHGQSSRYIALSFAPIVEAFIAGRGHPWLPLAVGLNLDISSTGTLFRMASIRIQCSPHQLTVDPSWMHRRRGVCWIGDSTVPCPARYGVTDGRRPPPQLPPSPAVSPITQPSAQCTPTASVSILPALSPAQSFSCVSISQSQLEPTLPKVLVLVA